MNKQAIYDKVTPEIATEWLRQQTEPGIYTISYDPDTDEVSVTATFSGDNSYIPGDDRITLAYADIREGLSYETLGLDDDGDIIDMDTFRAVEDEVDRHLDEVEED